MRHACGAATWPPADDVTFTGCSRTASFHAVRPSILGVIGLGAIGGSVARQAKQAGIATVLGWSPDPAERAAAREQRAVDDTPAVAADVARAANLLIQIGRAHV